MGERKPSFSRCSDVMTLVTTATQTSGIRRGGSEGASRRRIQDRVEFARFVVDADFLALSSACARRIVATSISASPARLIRSSTSLS